MSTQVDDLSEWRSFFDEAADFVEGIERQYGVANERFTEYAIDRLELTVQSCSAILDRFISATTEPLGEDDRRVVLQYREEMQDMISVLRRILQQWHEYRSVLDSGASSRYLLSYRSGTTQSGRGRGRPRFDVSIQQVQYLKSLVGDRSSSGSFSDDAVQVRDMCHSRTGVGVRHWITGCPNYPRPPRWSMSCNWLHSRPTGTYMSSTVICVVLLSHRL